MYEMKEEYRTGIELIDKYYERLFKIIDKAYKLLEGTSSEKQGQVVRQMERFKKEVRDYFKKQEEYLTSISYEEVEMQKEENKDFLDKLNKMEIEDRIKRGDQYVINILQYFSDWLVEHILNIEKKVAV